MSAASPRFDLAALNAMDRDAFVAVLGPAFENAPWVAAGAWSERPFASVAALHAAMLDVVRRVPDVTKMRTRLGWNARVPLEEGLRRTVDWYRSQQSR